MKSADKLVEFHFGSLSEEQRLQVEREILTDPEILLEYLDLKRSLEGAELFAEKAPSAVWQRLAPHTSRRKVWWSIGLSLATAAMATFILVFHSVQGPEISQSPNVDNRALVDSSQTDFNHPNLF